MSSFKLQRSVLIHGTKIKASNRINKGPDSAIIKVVLQGDHENKVSCQLELSLHCFSLSCNLFTSQTMDKDLSPLVSVEATLFS